MKVAIIGSRAFPEQTGRVWMQSFLQTLAPDTVIVSGGAKGPDSWAEALAGLMGLEVEIYHPNYALYGKGATWMRNTTIIDAADIVVAFWDGTSRGTKDGITKAKARGKPVFIVTPN